MDQEKPKDGVEKPWAMSGPDRIKAVMLENVSLFPALVDALSAHEIVSDEPEPGIFSLPSWMIQSFSQDLFDELYRHFFKGHFHDIWISNIASDVGLKGAFTYALFDQAALPYPAAKKWVEKKNREVNAWLLFPGSGKTA